MNLKFISLGSGSSGNCFYIGRSSCGILIDAGIGIRAIRKALRERGIALETIFGIFVTHDHADHIRAVGNLSEEYHIPVYTTKLIHDGMDRNFCMTKKVNPINRKYINKDECVEVFGFRVTPFEIPHDGTDNVGYSIDIMGHNFCFITDIGHITDNVIKYTSMAEYMVFEANYDEEMLANGPYPLPLQERIAGPNGHLSNKDAGRFLATHFPSRLRHVWLCHLSKENNKPHLAYYTVKNELELAGYNPTTDFQLSALPRTSPSEIFEL